VSLQARRRNGIGLKDPPSVEMPEFGVMQHGDSFAVFGSG
jgi:hypothetical protein